MSEPSRARGHSWLDLILGVIALALLVPLACRLVDSIIEALP